MDWICHSMKIVRYSSRRNLVSFYCVVKTMSYGDTYVTASRQHNRWEYLQNIYVYVTFSQIKTKKKQQPCTHKRASQRARARATDSVKENARKRNVEVCLCTCEITDHFITWLNHWRLCVILCNLSVRLNDRGELRTRGLYAISHKQNHLHKEDPYCCCLFVFVFVSSCISWILCAAIMWASMRVFDLKPDRVWNSILWRPIKIEFCVCVFFCGRNLKETKRSRKKKRFTVIEQAECYL